MAPETRKESAAAPESGNLLWPNRFSIGRSRLIETCRMSDPIAYDFATKLTEDESLLWTGRGSGLNLHRRLLLPMLLISGLGFFLVLSFPLSGFQSEMALLSLWGLIISGIVIWFFRARMRAPAQEAYAITNQRILIVAGPIGRICRSYYPRQKRNRDRRKPVFHAIKLKQKQGTIAFLTARSGPAAQGYPPIFVGVEAAEHVAQLAADTFKLKLIRR